MPSRPTLSRPPVDKQRTGTDYFFAPCPRGLAPALADELLALGAHKPQPAEAGVAFTGPFDLVYATNLHSRVASRILWRVAQFPYANENDVYERAKEVRWREQFSAERTFKVETNAHRSPVKSLDFVTLRVKDAIADHFRGALGRRPSVAPREPDVRVHAFLDEKTCTLYIDTSGEPLFKRGRRDHVGEAPLKKNLAAGILRIAGWRPGVALLDPMCGAGTFLSEAAEMSLAMAPGRSRTFGFQKLARYNPRTWERLPRGLLVTNPPYGVRLGEKEKLAQFYPQLGDALKKRFPGWTAYILSGDPLLAKLIRLQATKRTVLFNGALECRLFEYHMVAGGNRKP